MTVVKDIHLDSAHSCMLSSPLLSILLSNVILLEIRSKPFSSIFMYPTIVHTNIRALIKNK